MKRKKLLVTLLVVLVLVAALGYAAYKITLGYVGNKAVNMLLTNQLNSMIDSGEVTLAELEEIIVAEPKPGNGELSEATEIEKTVAENEEKEDETHKKPQGNTQTLKKTSTSDTKTPPKSRNEIVKKTTEKIGQGVSRADKEEIAKLVGSRLSSADVSYLMGLMSGGLTAEEISAAARLAYSRFTAEEIKKVKTFWHRYKNTLKRAP